MTDPQTGFRQIGHFLGLDTGKVEAFLSSVDVHYERSVHEYKRGGHSSMSSGSRDLHFHARTSLTEEGAAAFDSFYQQSYPELSAKYLSRYFETARRLA